MCLLNFIIVRVDHELADEVDHNLFEVVRLLESDVF